MISLVTRIRNSVIKMEKHEANNDKSAIMTLFSSDIKGKISKGELFYNDLVKMFEKS